MRLFYRFVAFLLGRNLLSTPVSVISGQLTEKRALPMGLADFHTWSDRIISGAACPATSESQKFTLAGMILHLKPTDAFVEDGYFINALRKQAANEVAIAAMQEVKMKRAAEQAAITSVETPVKELNAVLANAPV